LGKGGESTWWEEGMERAEKRKISHHLIIPSQVPFPSPIRTWVMAFCLLQCYCTAGNGQASAWSKWWTPLQLWLPSTLLCSFFPGYQELSMPSPSVDSVVRFWSLLYLTHSDLICPQDSLYWDHRLANASISPLQYLLVHLLDGLTSVCPQVRA
jgi:hypothetical protein